MPALAHALRCRPAHPLDHHAAFRAVLAAAPALSALSAALAEAKISADLVGAILLAASDLAWGFGAPPGTRVRVQAHARAWITVREIERVILEAHRRQLAPRAVLDKAQRAIDRCDVMITALPGVLPS